MAKEKLDRHHRDLKDVDITWEEDEELAADTKDGANV